MLQKKIQKLSRRKFLSIVSSFIILSKTLEAKDKDRFRKKRVALCIGHNKALQGAYGNAGVYEYTFNKELVEEIIKELKEAGCKNEYKIFFRPSKGGYTHQQIKMHRDIAKWGNVDYAIEFHFNSYSDTTINGHEVLYYSTKGKKLATLLNKQYTKYLKNTNRGIKLDRSGYGSGFLKRGNYASIIVEPFFASHQNLYMRNNDTCRIRLKKATKAFLEDLYYV